MNDILRRLDTVEASLKGFDDSVNKFQGRPLPTVFKILSTGFKVL